MFIGHLSEACTKEELEDLFERFYKNK
ncbi:hypothetical protein ACFQ38_12165 [Sporosarcina contaminans]|uniref:RNA-binding protein n=1 Tax=Sporosarcina contaminans TaxID=633403 RepID=A0ABW3TYJ6_9BACL